MQSWINAAVVACAIVRGDVNIPVSHRAEIARVEAEAFIAAERPHVSLETLMAIAYVETRFNPTGSERDRSGGMWGVMQIAEPTLGCWRTERVTWRSGRRHRLHVRYVRHDDPRRCTPEQLARRALLRDPEWNIRHASAMLGIAWERAHSGHRPRAIVTGWPGAYFWGSVPRRRRDVRRYLRYAALVQRAERLMHRQLQECRE